MLLENQFVKLFFLVGKERRATDLGLGTEGGGGGGIKEGSREKGLKNTIYSIDSFSLMW